MARTPARRTITRLSTVLATSTLLGTVGVVAAAPPPLKWATAGGGMGWDGGGPLNVLPDGSIISSAYVEPPAQFGPFAVAAGMYTVSKADASGVWQWVATAQTSQDLSVNSVSALPDGSSMVFGLSIGTATFGTQTITSSTYCPFVARLTGAGTWDWAIQAQCSVHQWGAWYGGIEGAVLPDGSAVFATTLSGDVTFGSYGTLSSTGGEDLLTGRISGSGQWMWARREGGANNQRSKDLSVTPDGAGMIVTGTFYNSAQLGLGVTPLVSAGSGDIFVEKLNVANAIPEWVTTGGGTGNDGYESVANSALPDGGALVSGVFVGTATFGSTALTSAGSGDIFVGRVTAAGAWDWALRAGGTNWETVLDMQSQSDGSAVLTGCTKSSFSIGGDAITVPAAREQAIFARLNADHSWAWAASVGSTGIASSCAYDIEATPTGGVVATGNFNQTATFGGTTTLVATGSPTDGDADAFLACFGSAAAACVNPAPPAAPAVPEATTPVATPAPITTPEATVPPANAASESADRLPALRGRPPRVRGGAVVTTGTPPAAATSVIQVATLRPAHMALTAFGSQFAKRVSIRCPITGTGASRAYTCVVRLPAGEWTLTTQARAGSAVIAQRITRARVTTLKTVPVTG